MHQLETVIVDCYHFHLLCGLSADEGSDVSLDNLEPHLVRLVRLDLMNSYIRVPTRAAVFISSSRLDREYDSYEHANAISMSELVNTTTLERTINSPSRDRPPRTAPKGDDSTTCSY